LESHRNLIVVQGRQKELSHFVNEEIDIWVNHWKRKKDAPPSALVWVSNEESGHEHLVDVPRVSLDMSTARTVLGLLRPEDEVSLD
jgi:hypothetical protein